MSEPASHPRHGEGGCEQFLRQAHRIEKHRGVELDVSGQSSPGSVLLQRGDGRRLHRPGKLEPIAGHAGMAQPLERPLQYRGARVANAVHTVARGGPAC